MGRRRPPRRPDRRQGTTSKPFVSWLKRWNKELQIGTGVAAAVIGLVFAFFTKALGLEDPEPTPSASSTPVPAPTGKPLRVTKVTLVPRQNDDTWVSESVVDVDTLARINRDIRAAGGTQSESADTIMRAAGAVETTMSTVEIELEGNRQKTVRIIDVRAVAQCREPLTGTIFYGPPQGTVDTVKLGFDLDEASPIARYAKPDPQDGVPIFVGDYFADHKYTLDQDDQVTFRLSARTFKSYCEYQYKFELIVDGEPESQLVDNNGQPFKVSAEVRDGPYRQASLNCAAYDGLYLRDVFSKDSFDPQEVQPWLEQKDAQPVCG